VKLSVTHIVDKDRAISLQTAPKGIQMDNNFTRKTVLVTGAASGIGRATALAFATQGAMVAVADINESGASQTVELIEQTGGQAIATSADVSQPEDVRQMVEETVSRWGKLDIAINNAGIFQETGKLADVSFQDWNTTLAVNLTGVWLCMKYEIQAMLQTGGGVIVNVSSVLGLRGAAEGTAYTASKHGVIGLTKSAALAYAEDDIRVNAVCPGIVDTPMEAGIIENRELLSEILSWYPMRRVASPQEAALPIVWLCSEAASYITGAILPVDGGHMAF
jgi:NAD(P)-dependent dehydrogenase (short-subunit alcohol dehydrogenase family)